MALRSYLRPYALRFVSMAVFAGLGIAATIVVPLITRAVVDGQLPSLTGAACTLGAAAIALGIVEALQMFFRRWVVSKATLGVEADVRSSCTGWRLPMLFLSLNPVSCSRA